MECIRMVCYYCKLENRNNPEIGNCRTCSLFACGPWDQSHGEVCSHCSIFFCYQHQHTHSFGNSVNPITSFPGTASGSLKIISDFIKEPTLRNTPFAIEHGIYLAKKLRDKEMEQVFKNVKSKVKVSTKGLANPHTTVAMRRLDKQPSSVGIRGISYSRINMHATNKNLNKLLSKDSQLMESRKLLSKMLQHNMRKIGSNISTHKRISMKRIGYGLTSAKTSALYGKTSVVSADKSKVSANKSK